jgi:hypothetical protein
MPATAPRIRIVERNMGFSPDSDPWLEWGLEEIAMPKVTGAMCELVLAQKCRNVDCGAPAGHPCRFRTKYTFHQVRVNDAEAVSRKRKQLEQWNQIYGETSS